ncbi:MAG: GntR family transcriptional regulator [Treponema sp.]|jgi:DNA-binding GntR family transcriptional regulator|nr:GntR family transcriptional regulator [Treponema sp.]
MHGLSVQDSVYMALRKSIINLNLLPGTVISEKEIAFRYEVSRTPVREAFIRLSKEALVKVIPQKKTLVSRIDFDRVEQERFLRESLEMAVLEPFIQQGRAEHYRLLEQYLEKQVELFNASDFINFVDYDNRFHQTFFDAIDRNLAWQILENMSGHYHRIRLLSVWLTEIAKNIIAQHRKLLAALKNGDLPVSQTILSAHLHELDMEETLLREKFPEYFTVSQQKDRFNVDFGGFQPAQA